MEELIDKYVRKHMVITKDGITLKEEWISLEYKVMDIFDEDGFRLFHWFRNNIGNVFNVSHPNGNRLWYRDEMIHREDGPAIIYSDGDVIYMLRGEHVTKAKWNKLLTST